MNNNIQFGGPSPDECVRVRRAEGRKEGGRMTERRRRHRQRRRRRLASRRRRALSRGPRAPAATRASFSLAPTAVERAFPEPHGQTGPDNQTIHHILTMCCTDRHGRD